MAASAFPLNKYQHSTVSINTTRYIRKSDRCFLKGEAVKIIAVLIGLMDINIFTNVLLCRLLINICVLQTLGAFHNKITSVRYFNYYWICNLGIFHRIYCTFQRSQQKEINSYFKGNVKTQNTHTFNLNSFIVMATEALITVNRLSTVYW